MVVKLGVAVLLAGAAGVRCFVSPPTPSLHRHHHLFVNQRLPPVSTAAAAAAAAAAADADADAKGAEMDADSSFDMEGLPPTPDECDVVITHTMCDL